MNRRQLLGRLAAVAGVAVLAPSVVTAEVQTAESRAYGELVWLRRQGEAQPAGALTVIGEATFVRWHDPTPAPLTFEAMQADCKARGCHLADQFNIMQVRHEFAHWQDGDQWADDTLTMAHLDPARVDIWRRSLHDAD